MKLSTITITLILCIASTTFAYDYTIDSGYLGALSLNDYETMLMTGGGIHDLDLFGWSEATIQNTDPLPLIGETNGGIWILGIAGYSYLDFSGGEVHQLDLGSYSTARLSGGLIDEIRSYQVVAPDPHIEVICRDWSWNKPTNILTGTWADYSTFDIRLYDQAPYDPVIENIKFTIVPEPFSLLLLAVGTTLLSHRRC